MNLKHLLPQLGIAKRLSGKRDPFNQFKRELNGLIDRALTGYSIPEIGHGDLNIDIYDKGKELEVKVEVPGVSEQDIHVTVQENNLIITGEKKEESLQEKNNYSICQKESMEALCAPFPFLLELKATKLKLSWTRVY